MGVVKINCDASLNKEGWAGLGAVVLFAGTQIT